MRRNRGKKRERETVSGRNVGVGGEKDEQKKVED